MDQFFFILTPISAIDKFKYKLPYKDIFGGVSAMSTKDFKKVNGYSNKFWGWGGEDDDMRQRIKSAGLGKKHDFEYEIIWIYPAIIYYSD